MIRFDGGDVDRIEDTGFFEFDRGLAMISFDGLLVFSFVILSVFHRWSSGGEQEHVMCVFVLLRMRN